MDRKISIVGVGNAGCKITDRLADVIRPGQSLVAINTDAAALGESRATTKIEIGAGRTRGMGAGGDVNLGRMSAEDDRAILTGLLAESHLVFVVAGLGGGTGTGATPVVLEVAREVGATTLCFAVLPFEFEGEQRVAQAEKARTAVGDAADAMIVVHNGKFADADGAGTLAGTIERANEAIAGGISSIFKLITQPGPISLSFADLQNVIHNSSGACTFGYATGEGSGRAETALKALLASPQLEEGRMLENAKSLLISIAGGSDFTVKEMNDTVNRLKDARPKNCLFSLGTVIDEDWNGRCSITLVASEMVKAEPPPQVAVVEEPHGKRGGKKGAKPTATQTTLPLDPMGGRFKDVIRTIHEGEDLDIPTFKRRGISIDK
ncbi:MAG: hypothetical protein C0404_02980 [Verrucomicrobia bacterium]|nr:hypothetical protein [Verrucomicrobiota bacterium]